MTVRTAETTDAASALRGTGVGTHFSTKFPLVEAKMIADAGFEWIRTDLFWEYTEKQKGVYDFSEWDPLLAALEANGLRAIWILDYANPLYDDGLPPHTDQGRQAFVDWVKAAMAHFAGHKIVWEVWNEPNWPFFWKPAPNLADYLKLAKATTQTIKDAYPDELVIGPASTNNDLQFLEGCFRGGLLKVFDGVSFHAYRPDPSTPRGNPESVIGFYQKLKPLMARDALPLISSEWGYSRTEVPEEVQARYLVRSFLCNLLSGVPLSIWYDWSDDGTDVNNREHNFGIVGNEFDPQGSPPRAPHLAYTAAKTFNAAVKGATFRKRVPAASARDHVLTFDTGLCVAWTEGSSHATNLKIPPGTYDAQDYLGEPLPKVVATAKGATVTIGDAPVYLTPRAKAGSSKR